MENQFNDYTFYGHKNLQILSRQLIPQHIRMNYPNFVEFMEIYLRKISQKGEGTEFIHNMLAYANIDETSAQFVDEFCKNYLKDLNYLPEINRKTLVKWIRQWYETVGSQQSVKFLFHVLYKEEVDFYFPTVDILRVSDGKWLKLYVIRLILDNLDDRYYATIEETSTDVNGNIVKTKIIDRKHFAYDIIGSLALGSVSEAECLIENYTIYDFEGYHVCDLYVTDFSYDHPATGYISKEHIKLTDINDPEKYFYAPLTYMVTKVIVDPMADNGAYYKIGDNVRIDHPFGVGAIAQVSQISAGSFTGLEIKDGGTGYAVNDRIGLSDGYGFGFYAYVTQVGDNGEIEKLIIKNFGEGYREFPNVIIESEGSGALLIPISDSVGSIVEVEIINPGINYREITDEDIPVCFYKKFQIDNCSNIPRLDLEDNYNIPNYDGNFVYTNKDGITQNYSTGYTEPNPGYDSLNVQFDKNVFDNYNTSCIVTTEYIDENTMVDGEHLSGWMNVNLGAIWKITTVITRFSYKLIQNVSSEYLTPYQTWTETTVQEYEYEKLADKKTKTFIGFGKTVKNIKTTVTKSAKQNITIAKSTDTVNPDKLKINNPPRPEGVTATVPAYRTDIITEYGDNPVILKKGTNEKSYNQLTNDNDPNSYDLDYKDRMDSILEIRKPYSFPVEFLKIAVRPSAISEVMVHFYKENRNSRDIQEGEEVFAIVDFFEWENTLKTKYNVNNIAALLNTNNANKIKEYFQNTFGKYPAGIVKRVDNTKGMILIDKYEGYEFMPRMNIIGVDSLSTGNIVIESAQVKMNFETGSISKLPACYKNTDGILSSDKKIQDSYYYQCYSYVLKTELSKDIWEKDVNTAVHPAGLICFGEGEVKQIFDNLYGGDPIKPYQISPNLLGKNKNYFIIT